MKTSASSGTKSVSVDRMVRRVQAELEGRARKPIRLHMMLSGTAGETWRDLRELSKPLGLEDSALLVLLLEHGQGTMRQALTRLLASIGEVR